MAKYNFVEGIKVVQDIEDVLAAIENKEEITRFEYGDSMQPLLLNGEYGHFYPLNDDRRHDVVHGEHYPFTSINDVKVGDAVFCKVNGHYMCHMVWVISDAAKASHKHFLIGSTSGQLYGWTDEILAIVKGTNVIEPYEEEENDPIITHDEEEY